MGEYIIIFLIALVCFVTTSTCQNESKESCWPLQLPPFMKTNRGTDVLRTAVYCNLTSQDSEVKLTFDINWALDAAEIDNNTLVEVMVAFWCQTSIELLFINPRNTANANKNILLSLSFVGGCKVWTRNLSVFAKATHFHKIRLLGEATWSSTSAFTNVTQGNDSFLIDLRFALFVYNLPENIHGVFNDNKIIWPNMTEISILDTPIKEIPEQMKITVPSLQGLYLRGCNLTEPPEFPWNNSALDRTELTYKLHEFDFPYQVQGRLYPRILCLDKNNIEDLLTSHKFRGFLHYLTGA